MKTTGKGGMLRFAGLAAATLAIGSVSTAAAQPDDGSGSQGSVTAVSTNGGPTLQSDDGGKTWRLVDPATAQEMQQRIGRALQTAASGTVGTTSISVDQGAAIATVGFETTREGVVTVTLHDARGREVTRVAEARGMGAQRIPVDISTLLAGAYIVRIALDDVIMGGGKLVITR